MSARLCKMVQFETSYYSVDFLYNLFINKYTTATSYQNIIKKDSY